MFLLLLYFVPLRISISQTTEDHKSPLKEQLQKSLSHVNDMLADIEGKIDNERKLLSQIDSGLNDKKDYMDYDVTDIWWESKENSTAPPRITTSDPEVSTTPTTPQPEVTVPTVIVTQPTPTLFPQPPPSTKSTFPEGWPFSTTLGTQTAESLFIQDMKKNMVVDHHGYCSAFLAKFTELISTKETANVRPLLTAMEDSVSKAIESGKFHSIGSSLISGVKMLLSMMTSMNPVTLQQQAGVAHYTLKHKNALMSKELNAVVNYYDKLFNDAEGEELFASLAPFEKYPDGGKSATELSERMLLAILAPVSRLEGKRPLKRLIQAVNEAIQDMYPNWRAQSSSPFKTLANKHPVNSTYNISGDKNVSAIPARRSLNYKRIIKHFLAKHPRYFRKLRWHHLLTKKNNIHRSTQRHRRHHNKKIHYRRGRHGRFEPAIKSASDETPDTSGSGAFYHESTTATPWPIKKNKLKRKRRGQTLRKRLHAKERQLRYLQEKQRQHKFHGKQRISTKVEKNVNPQYIKQLAINYFRQKQRGKNAKFRRFMDSSSNESNENNTGVYEDSEYSIENHVLRKITDFSSYSDEEEYLRSNLNDALRHGNTTFVSFRASDYNNHSFWDMTSASDDEWVLKNNIYKVFEQ